MSKKDNDQNQIPEEAVEETAQEVTEAAEEAQEPTAEEKLQQTIREQEDKYLRLLAEYDNYRKRSQKEKENAWTTAKADTIKELLPVYDNLERALKQETADEAYAKGVQMTMQQLKTVLEKLGVEEIPAQGEPFDPNVHNAVMHMEDDTLGENIVAEVFQAGFKMGEKIIRHAMVKVAN
ncbi:MAG: nucleotide exchange factor GrpE [Clostridiales bacterium]|nr:nucleotide exchange factor GrpE [Clostridiales bacterium]